MEWFLRKNPTGCSACNDLILRMQLLGKGVNPAHWPRKWVHEETVHIMSVVFHPEKTGHSEKACATTGLWKKSRN